MVVPLAFGLAAAVPASALAAQEVSAGVVDMQAVKAQIAADDRRHPVVSIELARATLDGQGRMTHDDRQWLLARLSRDLDRARRHDEALSAAVKGKSAAVSPLERVRFGGLAVQALVDAERYSEALKEYDAISAMVPALASDIGDPDARLAAANAWRFGGSAMAELGRLPEAMDLLTRALRLYDELNDKAFEESDTLNSMSLVHFRAGHADEALRTEQRAIDVSEAANEHAALSGLYLRKSHYLSSLGQVDAQYEALRVSRLRAREELNDYNLAVVVTNLADVALQKKDYAAVLRFAEEGMPLAARSGDHESLWVCWINKGIALNRLGRPGGIELIQQAIDAFSRTPGKEGIAADVHGVLAEEYAFNRDFERAYAASTTFKLRTDAVHKAADQKHIADTEAAYQADKKERQIESLQQEQRVQQRFQLLWAVVAGLGMLAAAIAIVSRHYLKRAHSAMRDMSLRDPLTGLHNRRYLVHRITEDLAQVRRLHANAARVAEPAPASNADAVFMMIDVDHFKSVNDVHGHAAGDAVLRQLAALLLQELRESDTLVRWGGEEFLVLARQASSGDAHALAERVRTRIAAHRFDLPDGSILRKTCSIGFACYPFHASPQAAPGWEDVVSLADQCLYAAKASGRDMWVGIVPGAAQPGLALDARLGVDNGTFVLRRSGGRDVVWPDAREHHKPDPAVPPGHAGSQEALGTQESHHPGFFSATP
jgi:diguanylate cyclase (GGDEF)-like protein